MTARKQTILRISITEDNKQTLPYLLCYILVEKRLYNCVYTNDGILDCTLLLLHTF